MRQGGQVPAIPSMREPEMTADHLCEHDYPRVLLVTGQGIGQRSGVGATLASLFGGWPRDRLAQILPPGTTLDRSLFDNTWILAPLDGGAAPADQGGLARLLRQKLDRARGYRLEPDLLHWIKAFDPQLIYSYLEIPTITHLVLRIAESLDVPVVPHIMDEWHLTPAGNRLSAYWWFTRQRVDLIRLLRRSPFGLSISDAMAAEYTQRYRMPFYTFMNSADPCLYTPQQQSDSVSSKLRMVYAGSGLGLGRGHIIANLARAVQELNRNGRQIQFSILVRTDLVQGLPQGDGVAVIDFVDECGLAAILSLSDVAVLAEGFDQASIKYSRLSFSSKIPVYLMSGCCILAIGSIQNNSIDYVKTNKLGVTIHEDGIEALRSKLEELYANRPVLLEFGRRNRQFAFIHHNQQLTCETFASLLARARLKDRQPHSRKWGL